MCVCTVLIDIDIASQHWIGQIFKETDHIIWGRTIGIDSNDLLCVTDVNVEFSVNLPALKMN